MNHVIGMFTDLERIELATGEGTIIDSADRGAASISHAEVAHAALRAPDQATAGRDPRAATALRRAARGQKEACPSITLSECARGGLNMHKPSVRSVGFTAAVVLMAFSVAWADPPACQVTDPIGDFFGGAAGVTTQNPCEGLECYPYQDIVQASALNNGGVFSFRMTLAAEVPAAPEMRPGGKRMMWVWNLNTDPTTAPQGFPFDPSTVAPPEFIVRVIWDETSFSGVVIDRRPLLTGGEANLVPVPFELNGSVVGAVVDGAILGHPTSFGFNGVTMTYTAYDGSVGRFNSDRTATIQCAW